MSNPKKDLEWVTVTVPVGDRKYPLRVQEGSEDRVHRAVELLNVKLKDFKELYAGKDKFDYLAMTALSLAMEMTESRENLETALSSFTAHLDQLEKNLAG